VTCHVDRFNVDQIVRYVYGMCQECDCRNRELLCTPKAVFVGFVQVRKKKMMYINGHTTEVTLEKLGRQE